MRNDNNAHYLAVLSAVGATIEKNKDDLAFANYEIERLRKLLADATKEIDELQALIPFVADSNKEEE